MKIAVTGGAGYLGSKVCGLLAAGGDEVLVLDDLSVGGAEGLPGHVRLLKGDIRDPEVQAHIGEWSPEALVNLAALHYIPACDADPVRALTVNAVALGDILSKLAPSCSIVVHASTAAVYAPSVSPHSEGDGLGPMDVYGVSKLLAERLLRGWHETHPYTRVLNLRLFNLYGGQDTNPHFIPAIVRQLESGRVHVGTITTRRDYVHVEDVAAAAVALLRQDAGHGWTTVNVGTGRSWSGDEVIAALLQMHGQDVEVIRDEGRVRPVDRPNLQANTQLLTSLIDWRPRELHTGLADVVR